MKANELMVGDWMQKLEAGGHYRKCRIKAIIDDNVDCVTSDGEVHTLSVNGIEPILLTAEILNENGFESNGNAIWAAYCREDKHANLEISEHYYYDDEKTEGGFYWTINCCEYDIIRLRYVHQLQHALNLCGIDKEIKL